MKRTFAVVALLAALGVLAKLAARDAASRAVAGRPPVVAVADEGPAPDPDAALRARYDDPDDRALVDRVLRDYHHNALAIEQTDGLRGLVLLDRLGLEAVYLYEKYPGDFRRLRDTLSDEAAADILLHWRAYFGLKRADEADRGILIAEIGRLSPAQRRAAARFPNALPLILAEPVGVTELIGRWKGDETELRDALAMLDFISLEPGAADLRAALRTLDEHGPLALEAFRLRGPEGFALVSLYGDALQALGGAMPLDEALVVLRVGTEAADDLLRTQGSEALAGHLRHIAAAGLVEAVGGSPDGLRLAAEHGDLGDQALAQAGPDAADVVYGDYRDPSLQRPAVAALAEHGPMALAMLEKYASDPDFRAILRRDGPAVIPPVARADAGPETLAYLRGKADKSFSESLAQAVLAVSSESGQATIRTIQADGLGRVAELESADVRFYQFLPLYDLVHLGRVVGHGHAPTAGEMTWAAVDAAFVVLDALSLAALQPEGVAAAEAAHSEVKSGAREALQLAGREAVEDAAEGAAAAAGRAAARGGSEAAAERAARWWAVRAAGGPYRVLRRLPEALGRLDLPRLTELGRPLAAKAGFRLTTWAPLKFLRNGRTVTLALPADRAWKYLGVQSLQAGVGVVAFHKMEEHLASRHPDHPEP